MDTTNSLWMKPLKGKCLYGPKVTDWLPSDVSPFIQCLVLSLHLMLTPLLLSCCSKVICALLESSDAKICKLANELLQPLVQSDQEKKREFLNDFLLD